MSLPVLADAPLPDPAELAEAAPTSAAEAADVIVGKVVDLWEGFLAALPLIILGLAAFVIAVMVAVAVVRTAQRGLQRTSADRVAAGLLIRMLRLLLFVFAALFALSVMGVPVGSVLAGFAVVGIAVGLAVQGILENFIAGVILLIRKPFSAGDQIRSGEFEGTVEDIDLRVTRLVDYDGETILIPNGQVFAQALINLTRRGTRRTVLSVGVDYRDDHDAAREVIRAAVAGVEGVREDPPPEVLLTALGDSSVDFDVRYWTAPDIASVRHVQDRVLAAVKTAIADAGMTIPWPIRTLVVDSPVAVRTERSA